MSRVTFGVILGLSIGVADVLLMLPLSFPDKRTALLAAFFSRFSLGFFAATINLPSPPIIAGLLVGLLTSIPTRSSRRRMRRFSSPVRYSARWLDGSSDAGRRRSDRSRPAHA